MKKLILLCAAAAAIAAPASAHHAFNMYENGKYVTLNGTVKNFVWRNPHAMVDVAVAGPGGREELWNVELSAPNIIGRRGWSRASLKPGDKVPMVIKPMKDGSKYGLLVSVTTPAGQVLKDKE